jgi:hypothetical protein
VPLEKVWKTAGDFTKSPNPAFSIEIVNRGDDKKMGVGCERKIQAGKTVFHERLTAIDPPNSYSYEMLSGAPVKYQRGKVELNSVGDSTNIKWSAEFSPKHPGSGWLIKLVTRRLYNKFIDELEKIK